MAEMSSFSKPVCISDFEKHAKDVLPNNYFDYFSSGATGEVTLGENQKAFKRLRLRPRVLRDVSSLDISTTILGERISFPICISPTASQKLAHPDGEMATARAASQEGICMCLSAGSSTTIEDVARSALGLKWFQLHMTKDRVLTKELMLRAEKAGFKAFVITVDNMLHGIKYATKRNHFDLPPHVTVANIDSLHIEKSRSAPNFNTASQDQSATWYSVITWLRSQTKLPIVVKGILTKENAQLAVQHGVDGILVSNHGARQLDTVPPTIEALPEVVKAVDGKCEVYLDGGVRFGTDVFKALALGAKAVFIGRPVLWGLAYEGDQGVSTVLKILKEEFRLTMGLMGCANLKGITREMVVHQSYYSRI